MNPLLKTWQHSLLNPNTILGAAIYALIFLGVALALGTLIRKVARRVETHLTDVTALRFASSFVQFIGFLVSFVLYAHLIPPLRAVGTALLAGVSVVSVVVGLAAQNTLGNLIAGFSLVLYRSIRVGDNVQITSPLGLTTGTAEPVSLGKSILRDADGREIVVPNSVMNNNIVIRLGNKKFEISTKAG